MCYRVNLCAESFYLALDYPKYIVSLYKLLALPVMEMSPTLENSYLLRSEDPTKIACQSQRAVYPLASSAMMIFNFTSNMRHAVTLTHANTMQPYLRIVSHQLSLPVLRHTMTSKKKRSLWLRKRSYGRNSPTTGRSCVSACKRSDEALKDVGYTSMISR